MRKVLGAILALLVFHPDLVLADESAAGDPVLGGRLVEHFNCGDCHGTDGRGRGDLVPNLAGQKFGYLAFQIELFRRGQAALWGGEKVSQRTHPVMTAIARDLDEQSIRDISAYYAALPCHSLPASERIGRPPEAKECEVCHGGTRTNPFTRSPFLAGQKQAYLERQLAVLADAVRNKGRASERYHRAMEIAAHDLNEEGANLLSRYFAALRCRKY